MNEEIVELPSSTAAPAGAGPGASRSESATRQDSPFLGEAWRGADASKGLAVTQVCRFCGSELGEPFLDLGMSPLANSFLKASHLRGMEPFYPLQVYVCKECLLVQLAEFESPARIFQDYAYFSSYADTWLRHARAFAELMAPRLRASGRVIEIGSNDGYLLQYFAQRGCEVLGIEPARNVAAAAVAKGIPTLTKFFSEETASELAAEGTLADLLVGNNVLAHVPKLNNFVRGLKILLQRDGVLTMEFPHLMRLMEDNQFDTIYHEHFSYFSLFTVEKLFATHGLLLFDVEEIPTHGGSLRIYVAHSDPAPPPISPRVVALRAKEDAAGLTGLEPYFSFAERVRKTKRKLLDFLIAAKRSGRSIVAYGAAAKGNTMLNYCGIGPDFLDYVVDRSPHKQGLFLPGTHIPICDPDRIAATRPDYVLILPWNLKDEVMEQMAHIRTWGGRFVVPIPDMQVIW